jgi:Fur family peroxide stress response transcriptional regulator
MITNTDKARRMLTDRGIKPTFQRAAILEAVLGLAEHPTIRSLHEKLILTVPTLSKTTLYSTLELFAGQGLVTPLFIDPAEVRYDGILPPHHHFYCSACRGILDIDIACANSRTGELHGHRIDEVHGYFKGVCRDCLVESGRSKSRATPKITHKQRRKANA